jgi:hypothetical protein
MWEMLAPATKPYENLGRDYIEQKLESGEYVLFKSNKACCVGSLIGQTFRVGLAGGDLKELINLEKYIILHAKQKNCKKMEIVGRSGWEKVLNNYKRTAVILQKEI